MSTETISVDSVCVDDDYRDSDNSSLRLVYVFMTIGPVKENLQVSSQYVKMRIGESNVYSSQLYPVNKYADNYYYSRYLEDVYISEQLKFVATFAVPEGDLTGGKTSSSWTTTSPPRRKRFTLLQMIFSTTTVIRLSHRLSIRRATPTPWRSGSLQTRPRQLQ